MSILGNAAEVEDAMQTVYIQVYNHLAQFENRSLFISWLTRIMLNQCYKQKHKAQRTVANMEQADNVIHMKTPVNILLNKELSSVLEQAIAGLPEKYRLVFVLREIEDMNVKETADVLNIEEPNVKVRLNRAKTMLRENLHGYIKDHVYSFHLHRCDKMVHYVLNNLGIV